MSEGGPRDRLEGHHGQRRGSPWNLGQVALGRFRESSMLVFVTPSWTGSKSP
jgi:hypothetical protein